MHLLTLEGAGRYSGPKAAKLRHSAGGSEPPSGVDSEPRLVSRRQTVTVSPALGTTTFWPFISATNASAVWSSTGKVP